MKVLVVLQNPYNKGPLQEWHPGRWKREYETSRSGKRLSIALPTSPDVRVHYTNANPKVGDDPKAKFDGQVKHVERALKRVQPDIVLACGKNAEEVVLKVWTGPLVCPTSGLSRTH